MKRRWERAESRTVRPFVTLSQCLDRVQFRLFADSDFDDRTAFDAADVGSREIRPEFKLGVETWSLR
jgi:hypothetical protein